ncbi:hypothetical protein N0V83_009625 [Neocucurbitaria cava]|uniref:Cytochrome P450 n=1 Tax=Neocucurbitaria cava TaxID=798079 RepID=A0A9W8Y1P9_9PLEO|nr:hypothetical protein N0V83_009625 [Neocucurbitaria cava]
MAFVALLLKVIGLGIILLLSQYALAYLRSPLRKIPGPFFAKFSNIWRFLDHYSQTHIETQKKLHEKYGDIVRLGPTTVSIADPSLIKTIYNTRGTFVKSDYYSVNDALSNGHILQNIFSTRSNDFNARAKKPVQKLYGLQNAMQLESLMDDDVRVFCSELESRFMQGDNKGKTCDIADWISYFAWDFLGHMTWSKRIGFMEKGEDVGGMLKTAENVMRYFSVVGQIPALDKWLGKNPYLPASLYKFDDFSVAAGFSVERFMERMQNPELNKGKKDFLAGFLEAKEESPELILGGADTLAVVIKALFYYLLKTPSAKAKLTAELRAANLSFPAPYKSLEHLPYLNACVSEALRIHPVVGHIFERVVPSAGLSVSLSSSNNHNNNGASTASTTVHLPPGTIVGVNPWVIHSLPSIFGASPLNLHARALAPRR